MASGLDATWGKNWGDICLNWRHLDPGASMTISAQCNIRHQGVFLEFLRMRHFPPLVISFLYEFWSWTLKAWSFVSTWMFPILFINITNILSTFSLDIMSLFLNLFSLDLSLLSHFSSLQLKIFLFIHLFLTLTVIMYSFVNYSFIRPSLTLRVVMCCFGN